MNILVADDSNVDRMLIEKLLKKSHLKVLAAKDGDEALDAYNKYTFDLAIIDWMMPPTGGLVICREIRESEAETGGFCYIIMVTGKNSVGDEVRAFNVGVNDFITKPFDSEILIARVNAGIRIIEDRKALTDRLNNARD